MNIYGRLLHVLDVTPETMSNEWAPIYTIARMLEAMNPPQELPNIVDEFVRQLKVYAGGRWPWVQAVEARMNEFRTRL